MNIQIPSVQIKNLQGNVVNATTFANGGKPMLVVFWAAWAAPSKKELDTIQENLASWVQETGVKVVACAIDDQRTSSKVATTVEAKGWDVETYLDENQDLKRAVNVDSVPHTFLINGAGVIVWEQVSYNPGDETKLSEKLGKVARGEAV